MDVGFCRPSKRRPAKIVAGQVFPRILLVIAQKGGDPKIQTLVQPPLLASEELVELPAKFRSDSFKIGNGKRLVIQISLLKLPLPFLELLRSDQR